jgi:hypothetical protein
VNPLRAYFKLTATLLIGSGVLACTCAAYDVEVGHLWGTLLQVVGYPQRLAREEVIVRAGQVLSVEGSRVTVRDVPAEAMNQRLAWADIRLKDGWVAFQGQTLESVVEEFNRHNERQLVIGDLTTAQLRIGGKFRVTDIDGFVAALAVTHGVRALAAAPADKGPQAIVLLAGAAGAAPQLPLTPAAPASPALLGRPLGQ